MRSLYCLIFTCFLLPSTFAKSTCQTESAELLNRANAMTSAFTKGDAEAIVAMTDPSLFELAGGKEKLLAVTKQAMDSMKQADYVLEKATLGKPTKTYLANKKAVCFIPKELTMNINGRKGRSVGYLVAIKDEKSGSQWLFLDSAGFQKKPELLWRLVPGLPKKLELPPNFTEVIQ